jgi:hypothetical protein
VQFHRKSTTAEEMARGPFGRTEGKGDERGVLVHEHVVEEDVHAVEEDVPLVPDPSNKLKAPSFLAESPLLGHDVRAAGGGPG